MILTPTLDEIQRFITEMQAVIFAARQRRDADCYDLGQEMQEQRLLLESRYERAVRDRHVKYANEYTAMERQIEAMNRAFSSAFMSFPQPTPSRAPPSP